MQNKNPGNTNWKDTLDNDTAFAGNELLNTNAAWDKLYNRMQQPRRKKAVWYWAAAASLLLMISALILSKQKIHNNDAAITTPTKQVDKLSDVVKEQPTKIIIAEKDESLKVNAAPINKAAGKNTNVIPEQNILPLAITNENKIAEKEVITILPEEIKPTNDTVTSVVLAAVQPKAKLKVVHINELGNPSENKNIQPGGDYSVIQFGIISQQANSKTALPSGNIGLHISTSKSSSPN